MTTNTANATDTPKYPFIVLIDTLWLLSKYLLLIGAAFAIVMNGVSAFTPTALVNSVGTKGYKDVGTDGCMGYRASGFSRDNWRAAIHIYVAPNAASSFETCKARLRAERSGFVAHYFLDHADFHLVVTKPKPKG